MKSGQLNIHMIGFPFALVLFLPMQCSVRYSLLIIIKPLSKTIKLLPS